MALDLENMMVPVSADNPAGENQEYNQLFLQLDELSVGVPASQMGDSVIEGRDPDWRQLRKNCLALWKNTRDLRLAVYLSVAGLCLEGLSGFNEGLSLVRYLVSDLWEDFWPKLDPDDDNDPLERINILSMISPQQGSYNDPVMFINHFRNLKLTPDKNYTLRQLMISSGELDGGDEKVDPALLNAEMLSVPMQVMAESQAALQKTVELLKEIQENLISHIGDDYPMNFSSLQSELKRLSSFYANYVHEGMAATESEPENPVPQALAPAAAAPRNAVTDLNAVNAGSRAEALLLLRKGCEYFQRNEPTSPVPYFINRALRTAEMNFMDLLAEIDPNTLDRGRDILGVKNNSEEN